MSFEALLREVTTLPRADTLNAHLGGLTSGIHSSLLASEPANPEGDPVLKIFNDWPKDWDAAFPLLARGGFEATSTIKSGDVSFVELHSFAGSECKLKSPWQTTGVTVFRDSRKGEDMSPDATGVLRFPTRAGEHIVLTRTGFDLQQFKVKVPEQEN